MKITLLFITFCFATIISFAQSVPQGMKYQAVARNLNGTIMSNQNISLKINLVTQQGSATTVEYSEVHNVSTNLLGLFTLTIGEGSVEKGTFKNVPWSTADVWMQVAIKDKADFVTISNSKLFAVPYAFHALTAERLAGGKTDASSAMSRGPLDPPMPLWTIRGNADTNPATDKLGTTDSVDLILVSNNKERIKIYSAGNVAVRNTLTVDSGLTVKQSVQLNTISGTTDIKGATNLQNTLDVTGATKLKNTLDVTGVTTYTNNTQSTSLGNGALVVAGGASIGGNLNLGGIASFGGPSIFNGQLQIANQTQSTSTSTGAVIVNGGVGIGKNLTVGGNAEVTGKSKFNDSVAVIGNVSSKSLNISDNATDFVATFENKNDGAGDGIKIKLGRAKSSYTVNEITYSAPELALMQDFKDLLRCDFPGGTAGKTQKLGEIAYAGAIEDLKSMAGIAVGAGNMIIDFINTSLSLPLIVGPYTTPAFHLSDAIDVTGPINSQLSLPIVLPALYVPAVKFPALSTPKIVIHTPDPLPNIDLPGFEITSGFEISPSIPLIGATTVMPRLPALSIPALNIPELNVLPQVTVMPKIPTISIPGITPVNIFDISFWGIPDICLTDGAGTSPLNNDNIFVRFEDKNGQKVGAIRGVSVTNWAANFLNPAFLFKLRGALLSSKIDKFHAQYHFKGLISEALTSYGKIGVEYTSGNGDYAEWLERSDKSEVISAGDIVAVEGGKITKDLTKAEQVMVVSSNPIMLGNMPAEAKVYDGNNIAFIGQIPVKIMGPVATGDYILGKSSTPGYGIAKHSNAMSIEDYRTAVGRSWVNDLSEGPKMVNTVVGVHNNNFLNIIKEMKEKEVTNDARLKAIETKLNMTVPSKTKSSKKSLPKSTVKSAIHG